MTLISFPIISRYYKVYAVLSFFLIAPGLLSLFLFGLRPSIDFTGGTLIEFSGKTHAGGELATKDIETLLPSLSIERFTRSQDGSYTLKLPPLSDTGRSTLTASLSAGILEYSESSLESVGPVMGAELVTKTVVSLSIASLLILGYLGVRFRSIRLGLCALGATLHDVLVVLGVMSILGHLFHIEVDLLFVTALLTIVSFSVHDTVVVYDRLRERRRRFVRESMKEAIDRSVLTTLLRSMRNAGAVLLTLLSLFILGGESIRWFAFALLIGTVSGTYSSTFVALPLLYLWDRWASIKKSEKLPA